MKVDIYEVGKAGFVAHENQIENQEELAQHEYFRKFADKTLELLDAAQSTEHKQIILGMVFVVFMQIGMEVQNSRLEASKEA